MTKNWFISELDRLKRENARLRRTLSVFAEKDHWVFTSNSDLLTDDVYAFVPDNNKIRELPWQYAKRAISYKSKLKKDSKASEKQEPPRFSKLL